MSDDPLRPGDDEPEEEGFDLSDLFGAGSPFGGELPPEFNAMLEKLGGSEGLAAMGAQLSQLFAGGMGATGPVDWNLASRVALQLAADGDRGPTPEEESRARQAFELAEHWLDDSPLPASPDAGRLLVASRQTWVNAALVALRPLVEPVARASSDAMVALAQEQLGELGPEGPAGLPGLEGLPPGIGDFLGNLGGMDLGAMLRPAGAALMGLQAGQVVGRLAQQLLGQYDLGIPTAPRAEAYVLAVNVHREFDGWDLDPMEVAVVLALTEAAHRRLFHAVPWLEAHVQSLVARFASGTTIDAERMRQVSEDLMMGVDPDDPDSLQAAMERAAQVRVEPTADQLRVLERLQAVVCLVGAWARHEAARVAGDRLPGQGRVEEVLRRRRATRGDGEELLAALLGLDLKPADETVGESFVRAVEAALGPQGLHRALAHPENLPDATELADPSAWLERTAEDHDVPDDLSELLSGDFGEAPVEGSAEERLRQQDDDDDADGNSSPS
ncbi:zinc-dependent metalloprotease [Egicoccus halophilus]|uniref:Hydrolase n=1 Tax=Egicoccus halophilus TaxID=1670830 RepID=A0A8J3EYX6_9ACTN|nr:zinc-dependent metalloprotease [Egicoccus halophilus]GGI08745.1 hypothetical protein GCM10011354_30620 [Egicoccus halophilus]